jgi:hypothetical protein
MSADNGVYILATRGKRTQRGHKTEYRVAHAQSIGNIMWKPDYPRRRRQEPLLNREWAIRLFGASFVFTDRRLAEAFALAIHEQWMKDFGVVEYGIKHLDFSAVSFPQDGGKDRLPEEALKEALAV